MIAFHEQPWAIGTGKTATADQAQEIHAFIRKVLADKFGAAASRDPDPLRRFVQALKRGGTLRQGGRGRRTDRRCRPTQG